MKPYGNILVLALGMLLAGCARNQVNPLFGPGPTYPYRTTEAHSAQWRLADSLWGHRLVPKAAKQSLAAYRSAARSQKHAPELLARLSHACYFVATYIEFNPASRDRLFREGQAAAEEGMLLHPAYRAKYEATGDELEAAGELGADYVEILYWYVVNLGREINQEGVIIRRGNKARMETLTNHLLRLDETFYHAGPHRIAGVVPTRLPEGDMRASKAHFEKAIALAPEYLGNHVAFADFYAIRVKDKQLFLDQLNLVAAAPVDKDPDIEPENRIAQAQAKSLLAKADSLFP